MPYYNTQGQLVDDTGMLGNVFAQTGQTPPVGNPTSIPTDWAATHQQSKQAARAAARTANYGGQQQPAQQYDGTMNVTNTTGNTGFMGGKNPMTPTGGTQRPVGGTLNYDAQGNQLGAPTLGTLQPFDYSHPDNPNQTWMGANQTVPDWTQIEDPFARLEWKIRSGYPTALASHANTNGGFDPAGYQDPYAEYGWVGNNPVPTQWLSQMGALPSGVGGTGAGAAGVGGGGYGGGGIQQAANGGGTGAPGTTTGPAGLGNWFQSLSQGFPQNTQQTPGLQATLNSLLGGGGLDKYVSGAPSGMQGAFQQQLANQLIDLQSKYAGEGSFLSSPMFAAEGQLRANLTADFLNSLGQMQLGAAEGERGRQTQTSLGLSQMYSELAKQAMASGATLQAAQWQTMADMYRTQAGTAADIYRTDAGTYGNELQYNLGLGGLGVEQQRNLLQSGVGMYGIEQQANQAQFEQLMKLATLAQQGDQNALTILANMYNQPGGNALNLFQLLAGINNVSSATGSNSGTQGNPLGGAALGGLGQLGGGLFGGGAGAAGAAGAGGAAAAGGAGAGGAGLSSLLIGLCWVAEELYGKDHPKTQAARRAMLTRGGWFAQQYREKGREWAALLKQHPFLKPLIQPVWDELAYAGGYREGEEVTHARIL